MSKKWIFWMMGLVLVTTLVGCGMAAPRDTSTLPHEAPPVMVEREEVKSFTAGAAGPSGGEDGAGLPDAASTDRKIIYNVALHLIVKDTAQTFDDIRRLTQEMGGFVADSNTWKDGEQLRGTLTVRVPVENLEKALSEFRALALDVESEQMDSQDVTEEYVDLEARLKNEQRTEAELLELLESRSDTGKTSDILEVHRELTTVRAQIEQIQGRMKYLDTLSALATIQVTLTPDALMQPVVVAGWRPQGTAREAARLLLRTLQFFADVSIVFVIYILPVLIILAIPVVIAVLIVRAIWKRVKQRRAQRLAQKAAQQG